MNLRPVHLLVPLLGIVLAFVSPFDKPQVGVKHKKRGGAAAVPAVGGKWSDARWLNDRMEETAPVVTSATGLGFVDVPSVKPSTADEVAGFLREDMDAAFHVLGATDDAAKAKMSRDLAAQLVAAYDPKANVIHVLPVNAVAAAKAAGDDSLLEENVLRLVLVRMGVVAVDRQVIPEWKAALDNAKTIDAVQCAGAVFEGYAQYTTRRIADNWAVHDGFPADAFDKLVTLQTTSPTGSNALADAGAFALEQGYAFMKATARKRSFKKILREPPTDRNLIFHPDEYLKSFSPAGRVPARVAKEFATVTPKDAGWSVSEDACAAAYVEGLMAPLERTIWAGEVASYKKGRQWTAVDGAGHTTTSYLLEFRTGGMAASYVTLAQSAAGKRGVKVEEGAGRDASLAGFAGTQEHDGKTERMQMTIEGRFVVGFVSDDPKPDRDAFDDALDGAAEVLAKLQKTRKNRRDK